MELEPGQIGHVVAQHRNSEDELVTIEIASTPRFAGQWVLCIYDDDTPTVAPLLLDMETRKWLVDLLLRRVPVEAPV